ncbi:TPA: hypothetical protein ACNZ6B_005248, partial [Klebsiella quasipneumoniae]
QTLFFFLLLANESVSDVYLLCFEPYYLLFFLRNILDISFFSMLFDGDNSRILASSKLGMFTNREFRGNFWRDTLFRDVRRL